MFFFTVAFAQKRQLPEIPFNWYRAKVSPYYKLLGIKDKSAIIITIGELPDYNNLGFKYAVFYSDGSVKMFIKNDLNIFTELIVSDAKRTVLKDFLYTTNWLEYGEFNLRGEPTGRPGETTIFLDGTSDYLSIIQGNKEFLLSSRNTLSNIELKVTGWEDRMKFLELIKIFQGHIRPIATTDNLRHGQ